MKIPRYCTVLSNGCLKYFTANTLTNFANVLPSPIYPESSSKLYVRLRALAINTRLLDAAAGSDRCHFIKIKLGELEPQVTDDTFETTLATLSFPPPDVYEEYGLYNFENKPFLPLEAVPLQKLSIHIVNSAGETLPLAPGPPTILKLELSDMDLYNQFTVTCTSTKNRSVFPSNSMSDFSIRLPGEMNLAGWEVAVQSVAFPNDFVVKNREVWMDVNSLDNRANDVRIRLTIDDDDTPADFEALLTEAIRGNEITNNLIVIEDDPDSNDKRIRSRETNGDRRVEIVLDGLLRRAMETVNFDHMTLAANESVRINARPNLNFFKASSIAFLYTNCIEENIISDGQFQLLQIVPVKKKTTEWEYAMYEPQHLLYHPVRAQTLTFLSIQFLTPDGYLHRFASETDQPMIVTLVFRPSRLQSAPTAITTTSRFPGGSSGANCSVLTGTCD